MKLENCEKFNGYVCDLTKELDDMSGLSSQPNSDVYHHYIVTDDWCRSQNILAIRVPGGTVGEVSLDSNNIITNVVVNIVYVIKTYPPNTNELLQKYIGTKVEW